MDAIDKDALNAMRERHRPGMGWRYVLVGIVSVDEGTVGALP